MKREKLTPELSRRRFLKVGGGLVGLGAAATLLPRALLLPERVAEASFQAQITEPNLQFAATDGWIHLPGSNPPYHPDNMAPEGLTTYIFGFRNVTGLTRDQAFAQKMKAQLTAPTFWFDEWRDEASQAQTDFTLKLTNLGLQIRPDLIDAHTMHFHGFRNAIPIFDGEPHSSVGVPISRDLTYFYRGRNPGTYMYHCHFEETEHVHMGMVGGVFIRPKQNYLAADVGLPVARLAGNMNPTAPMGYTYNDGDGSTAYDREFVLTMNEVWTLAHWCDSHVQLPEWSDYNPDFYLINGRSYPETILPNGGERDAGGDLLPPVDEFGTEYPHLRYQPISSLIRCNAGDRVLLRLINLGYTEQAMRLAGIKMRVVGKDASPLMGRDRADLTEYTETVVIGPGESADAIFVAPDVTSMTRLLLFTRYYTHVSNVGAPGLGGQVTEVHIYPEGTLSPQTKPNDWG